MLIQKILADGIYFINDCGQNDFISFSECNKNWLAYRKRTELLNDEQAVALSRNDKTVGQRDFSTNYNSIEFFSRPFTKFVFNIPEQIDAYHSLRDLVVDHGWSTHDLS